jgi:membrane protease subunit HflK
VAWNQPGGGDKDPWSSRGKSGGSDVDVMLRRLQNKLRGLFGGGDESGGNGLGIGLIVAAVIFVWLITGFYVVQEGERGMVLRFGRLANVVETPGIKWRIPFPVERIEKVNVVKVSVVEIGYRSNQRTGGKEKVPKEALMLTQDENIIDIGFAVQYRIKNASEYLFMLKDQETTISQATEAAVREVVGKNTLDFVLTEGRRDIENNVKTLLQNILDRYKSGIEIVAVEAQKGQPPEEVKSAFDDAVKAREDEQRLKNEAETYANDIIPRARGSAARLVQQAEGYKSEVIARAEGDARRFTQVSNEYVKAPGVTRERMYIETMEEVLSNTTKVLVDQKGGNNLIYLPLDKLMKTSDNEAAPDGSAPALETPSARGAFDPRSRDDLRSRRTSP